MTLLFFSMKRKWPLILWLILIVIISGFPGDKVPEVPVWQFDKLVHAVIYFILSLTMLYAYDEQYSKSNKRLIVGVLVAVTGIIHGGIMEILQEYIFINRSGNWYDFVANAFGAIFGVLFYPFVMKLLPKIS